MKTLTALSQKQRKILAFEYSKQFQTIVCNGAVRSGKTSIMTVAFIDWAMRNYNHKNFLIASKTMNACYRNVITPYLELAYTKKRYMINVRRSDNYMVVSNDEHENTFYFFGGRDESSYMLVQGITAAGILLDETPLMPQSFVNQAMARCSVEGAKYWLNCNPAGSKEHWFYKEWIEDWRNKKALVLNFTIDDNPSLSEETKNRYKNQFRGVFYRRYILGEWVAAEGSFFTEPPEMTDNVRILRDGRAHVDAAYGGADFTALTIAKRVGDTIYVYGRLWQQHVDTVMDVIVTECKTKMAAPLYLETNADKGFLGRELRARGMSVHMYTENLNKFMKITTVLRKWWPNIVMVKGTDPAYIAQIMDFTEEAAHDDAPDSLACLVRVLDKNTISL